MPILSEVGLAFRQRGRFALNQRLIVGFDFCHGTQSAAELPAASVQIPPFRVARTSLGRQTLLIQFFLAGRQLGVRVRKLPFQIRSFLSHVRSIGLNKKGAAGVASKNEAGILAGRPVSFNARCHEIETDSKRRDRAR